MSRVTQNLKPVYQICKQHNLRPVCAFEQSGQRFYCLGTVYMIPRISYLLLKREFVSGSLVWLGPYLTYVLSRNRQILMITLMSYKLFWLSGETYLLSIQQQNWQFFVGILAHKFYKHYKWHTIARGSERKPVAC